MSCESANERCTDPASWEEVRITPASFNIRNAPFARGYFLGDYMGLDNAGNAFLPMFGQAFTPNDRSYSNGLARTCIETSMRITRWPRTR